MKIKMVKNVHLTYSFSLALLFVCSAGCSPGENKNPQPVSSNFSQQVDSNSVQSNAQVNSLFESDSPVPPSLQHDVERFYAILRQKDWSNAYELRWKTYRQDYPKATYLKQAQKEEAGWELLDVKILNTIQYGDDEAIIMCKFVEMPGRVSSYNVVFWHKEFDGVWRCDAAGPVTLTIFKPTRVPVFDDN